MAGAIDILCNHFTQESIDKNFINNEEEADRFEQVGRTQNLKGHEPADLLKHLSSIGVDKLLVTAIKSGLIIASARMSGPPPKRSVS